MNRKSLSILLAIPLGGAVLFTTGCDDRLNILDPRFSFIHSPGPFYTIVNSATNQAQLVRVDFNQFGTGYKLYTSSANIPGPRPFSVKPGVPKLGGGTLDPDPDEHQLCPDLWPDPFDEIPLPDPPLPMPDYPDEDPFDGIPEPPPFPDDNLTFTDLSNNDVTTVNSGGTDTPRNGAHPESTNKGSLRVGVQPAGISATPDHSVVLVANMGDDTVSVIQNGSVAGTIKLPGATKPYAIAISQDGKRGYVTSFVRFGGALLVLDVPNRSVITSVIAGNFSAGVALTPDQSQVWVTSKFEDTIYIYDTLTNTLVTRITGATNSWGIAFNPTGTRAFVAASDDVGGGLYVIDTASYQILTRISVGDGPRSVQVDPAGRHVFVTNRNSNFISQIDARTNKLIRNIVVGPGAEGIGFVR